MRAPGRAQGAPRRVASFTLTRLGKSMTRIARRYHLFSGPGSKHMIVSEIAVCSISERRAFEVFDKAFRRNDFTTCEFNIRAITTNSTS